MSPPLEQHDPLRFALVGYGRVAPRHIRAMAQLSPDEARWVAVCDIDPGARARAAAELDVPTIDDFETLLREVAPDVVVLATPSGVHPTQSILASRAGVHVITEKPMATRWSDASRMVEAARDARTRLFVVKQQRYAALVQKLRAAIDQRRFGRIYAANLNVAWCRPQHYYDLAEWRGTWELDGGALMNQAIHYIDLLQWLLGPVESVHAFTATLARSIEVEDTAALTLRWRSGAVGSATITMLAPGANFEAAITILGERGVVRLGGVACDEVHTWRFADGTQDEVWSEPNEDVYGAGHIPFYQDVVADLRTGSNRAVDGAEGLKALEIVIAAYRSSQTGQRVALPLEL